MTPDLSAPHIPPLPIEPALTHFRVHGWARLGRVASDACLEQLRARADDLMFGRVVHEGLFFQHDAHLYTIFGMTSADSDLVQIQENVISRAISSLQFAKQ